MLGVKWHPFGSTPLPELSNSNEIFQYETRKTGYKEEILYTEGGEAQAQVAQRGDRCPIPGNIPGQVGRGSEQPDPVEDVPAHCRGVGLDGL